MKSLEGLVFKCCRYSMYKVVDAKSIQKMDCSSNRTIERK